MSRLGLADRQALAWAVGVDEQIYICERTREEMDNARMHIYSPWAAPTVAELVSRIACKAGVSDSVFVRAVLCVDRFENLRRMRIDDADIPGVVTGAFLLAWEVEGSADRAGLKVAAEAVLGRAPMDMGKWHDVVFYTLGYDVGFPTGYTYLQRFGFVAGLDEVGVARARFAVEAGICHGQLIRARASRLAAAAVYVALVSCGREWPIEMAAFSGFRAADLADTGRAMVEAMRQPTPFIGREFSAQGQHGVASRPLPDL
jgi:hypothetical protein